MSIVANLETPIESDVLPPQMPTGEEDEEDEDEEEDFARDEEEEDEEDDDGTGGAVMQKEMVIRLGNRGRIEAKPTGTWSFRRGGFHTIHK